MKNIKSKDILRVEKTKKHLLYFCAVFMKEICIMCMKETLLIGNIQKNNAYFLDPNVNAYLMGLFWCPNKSDHYKCSNHFLS